LPPGLGQHARGQGRDDQADRHVDEEHPAPAEVADQQAAGDQPDRDSGDAHRRIHAHRAVPPRAFGEGDGDQRQGGGRGHCPAGALDGARGEQPRLVGGGPAEQRGQREDQNDGDEDPAAPQQVAGCPAERTRQQILETAIRLFTELGYDATSLQMIADEMGLTKAAVYYHFRAKTDILHAAMLPGMQQLGALLDEAATIRGRRARTEYLVNGITEFLVPNRHYAAMASTDPAAKRDKLDEQAMALRRHALTLLFGDNPTGAERLAFNAVYLLPDCLSDLTDLTDSELREALRTMAAVG
jgi:AcrR family transcriptional regulator